MDGPAATRACDIAANVLARVAQPDVVDEAIGRAERHATRRYRWRPAGLWQGDAGLALACGTADAVFPGAGFDAAGHTFLQRATHGIDRRPAVTGLADGLGALGLAAADLSRGGARYRNLRGELDRALAERVVALAATLRARPTTPMPVSAFDVISGLSGVGRHLLDRRTDPRCATALDELVGAVVARTRASVGWSTPPELINDPVLRRSTPHGHLNLGLAHGVPGPLALLALSHLAGVRVDGLDEAITGLADLLVDAVIDGGHGPTWPTVLPLGAAADARPRPSRTAWCYGSPGIARALWFASRAVSNPTYAELAVAAMRAVVETPVAQRHIDAATVCHGVAGLQQVVLRFAVDTGHDELCRVATDLHEQLLAAHEPDALLGYRNLQPDGTRVDEPGLLTGATGVAMVLLAASTPVEPIWDRALLLS